MKTLGIVIAVIIGIVVVVFIGASLWTWLIMLTAGALGYALGFWTLFPAGLLLSFIISAIGGNNRRN